VSRSLPVSTDPARPARPSVEELPRPGLTWGLKRSFIRYISTLPDGTHTETAGATLEPPSLFRFSPTGSDLDPTTGLGTMRFRGEVRLGGHRGMLGVLIADPWVKMTAGGAVLSVVDARHWPDRSRRLALATLASVRPAETPDGLVWGPVPAHLTAEGAHVFGGQYAAGEEMDTVVAYLPAGSPLWTE
jgi:hypothetical protein